MRLLEILRIIIVSYEALFAGIVVLTYNYFPELFMRIGNPFKSNDHILQFMVTVPIGMCVYSVQQTWKILMPLEGKSNRKLHEWPNYWKIKYRVIISSILCTACIFSYVCIWIFGSLFLDHAFAAIFITSIIIPVIVAFSVHLAALKVRELMEP
jgi:hypothetical protein